MVARADITNIEEKKQKILSWLGMGAINVFGRPFAGKDVQCNKLNEWLNTSIIGGGDIIRTKEEAAHLRESHDRGELTPTDEFLNLVLRYFSSDEFHGRPIILSSMGRWHGEEGPISNAAAEAGHPIKAVVYIDISDETAAQRLEQSESRGRGDDKQEVILTRLSEFKHKTLPVIDYYQQKGILVRIDGNQTPDEVQNDIIDGLYKLAISPSRA